MSLVAVRTLKNSFKILLNIGAINLRFLRFLSKVGVKMRADPLLRKTILRQ